MKRWHKGLIAFGALLGLESIALETFANYIKYNPKEPEKDYYQRADEEYRNAEKDSIEDIVNGNYGILFVDMQFEYLEQINIKDQREIIRNQKRLLVAARENDIPVLVFEMGSKGETISSLKEIIDTVPRHKYFEKYRDDGFESYNDRADLPENWLREQNVEKIIFTGVNTDACIFANAESAVRLSFGIVTSTDLVASMHCNVYCERVAPALNYFLENGVLLDDSLILEDFLYARN